MPHSHPLEETRAKGLRPTAERVCRVWVADIELHCPEQDALLDPTELARAVAFSRDPDRKRFVLGVALLKTAVAELHGMEAAAVRVDRRCTWCGMQHGPPRVTASALHVSVAHSGSRVIAAVSTMGPVGIDLEQRTLRTAIPSIHRVLTRFEPLSKADDFLTYWCRKESVLKATGDGLAVSPLDVVVSPASEPARVVSYRGSALTACMVDLDLGPRHAGALTVLTSDAPSVEVNWRSIL